MNRDLILIFIIAICTFLTRALPFLIFPKDKEVPAFIEYLGKVLPYSVMAMLVVYCFKSVNLLSGNHGLPEIIAGSITVLLHMWKENTLVSIIVGTIIYMIEVQMIFI